MLEIIQQAFTQYSYDREKYIKLFCEDFLMPVSLLLKLFRINHTQHSSMNRNDFFYSVTRST